ncbi:MAG: hypothetical protein ABJH98_17190 [Reichenbachiella sp.]|uniref:hypothetical protein n=1 Tax=Reichenbachiella sp. TaxID=2184521 RepID=UPI003298F58A
MKVKNIFITFLGAFIFLLACTEEFVNPPLEDSDLVIYKLGSGGNIKSEAWLGYEAYIGDSVVLDLQVSPLEGTDVRYVLLDENNNEEILSTSLQYIFYAEEEGTQLTYFIAERGAVADTVPINFIASLPGSYTSKFNAWQTLAFDEMQTGTLTYEFDMIPSKDNIDAVVGLTNVSAVTDYSALSAIVRFDRTGIIDSYNDGFYDHDAEVQYTAGAQYHVRMEVDIFQKLYSVFVTDPNLNEFKVAEDYVFRNKSANLTAMALVAGDWELDDPGTHRVFNTKLTSHTQNLKPSFEEVDDILLVEGAYHEVLVKATDPLGDDVTLEAKFLPRYARFEDLGGGQGLLTLNPYQDCSQCDVGDVEIEIIASSLSASNSQLIDVSVIKAEILLGHIGDAEVWFGDFANNPANVNPWRNDSQIIIGGGSNWQDPENDIYDLTGVFPFEIPDMEPGERFTYAALNMFVKDISPWAVQDYDLYGLPYRSDEYVLGTDYYQGAYNGDPNATALQQRFAYEKTASDATLFTSSEGSQAVMDYLNAQLDAGAQPGDFVYFRISVSVDDAETFGRIILWSADVASKAPRLLYDIN